MTVLKLWYNDYYVTKVRRAMRKSLTGDPDKRIREKVQSLYTYIYPSIIYTKIYPSIIYRHSFVHFFFTIYLPLKIIICSTYRITSFVLSFYPSTKDNHKEIEFYKKPGRWQNCVGARCTVSMYSFKFCLLIALPFLSSFYNLSIK